MEASNDTLFAIHEKLRDVSKDVLEQTNDLLTWAAGKSYRKSFLLELIDSLKDEQIHRFPQFIVLQKSIMKGKDLTKQPLLQAIKENCTKEEIELAEFILEDKQGSLSDYNYQILLSIKKDIPLPKGTNYSQHIAFPFPFFLYQWIDRFNSIECMKALPKDHFKCLVFYSITKEQFLKTFPGRKPVQISRQGWVYELNPSLLEGKDEWEMINNQMILFPSSIAKQHKEYTPKHIFPFVRAELFGIPEKSEVRSLFQLLDSLSNFCPTNLKDFFKQKPSEEIIYELINEAQELLEVMPKLYPQLSDLIIQLQPWLSAQNIEATGSLNSFLYVVLLSKGFAPKPSGGDEVVLYEYQESDFYFSPTAVFHPYEYEFTDDDFIPQLKDPRYFFGYGYSILDDALEDFIDCVRGKENEEYVYFNDDVTLKEIAASLGSERIWFYLELNGFPEGKEIERHAFGGRSMLIIKDVLKKTKMRPYSLLSPAYEVYNFEVFSYLIDLYNIKGFEFSCNLSPRFIDKDKTPMFYSYFKETHEIDFITQYCAERGLL